MPKYGHFYVPNFPVRSLSDEQRPKFYVRMWVNSLDPNGNTDGDHQLMVRLVIRQRSVIIITALLTGCVGVSVYMLVAMCLCTYDILYVYVYVHIYVYMYVCMYVCMFIYLCLYICMYVFLYCMYVCIYVCIYVCNYACTCMQLCMLIYMQGFFVTK